MTRFLMVLLCLLRLSDGFSSDKVTTKNTHVPDISHPKITRDYPACTEISRQNCVVVCSVSNVAQAYLLWYNGSDLYSKLMITDLNNKLYLLVENHDKNNYSCVVSSSGTSKSTYLNIDQLCEQCPGKTSITMSVSEGDSVTLPTNLTEVQYEDHIMWLYGDSLIAEWFENITASYDCKDGRFQNRLQLDSQTGSLTITNNSKIHSGLYNLNIQGSHQECQIYNVTVYDRLPVPVITNNLTQCSTVSNKCVVMCSVNVTRVTLSWYNESRLHSSISVSDLKRNNFLCLEVEYQDINTYSCVVNNSFTNQTTRLNVSELCKDHSLPFYIYIIIGGAVIIAILIIIIISIVIYCKKRKASREDGRQHAVSYFAAQANGASGHNTTDNTPTEETNLIAQPSSSSSSSSQESMPSKRICCK